MNHSDKNTIELGLYQTAEHPCSYLPNARAISEMVVPMDAINTHTYSELMHHGFRRSGLYVYRPSCPNCEACQPLRIAVASFQPNRSQRRTEKHWMHLRTQIHELEFNPEHFALYQSYQNSRHPDGDMSKDDAEQYRQFLLKSNVDSLLVEFRDEKNALVMVSLIDKLADGLSAVYTFYDTNIHYSGLGIFNILWQIQVAHQLNLPYVYLGYWVKDSAKMAYKANFSASQILLNGKWQPLLKPQTT